MADGLDGVVATSTRLSHVDGEAGRLTLAGYAVEDLAPHASFEEVAHLSCTAGCRQQRSARSSRGIWPDGVRCLARQWRFFAQRPPRGRRRWMRYAWPRRC